MSVSEGDHEAADDLTPEDGPRLREEAMGAYKQAYALSTEADLLLARSEIVIAVAMAEFELQAAEEELVSARSRLASVTAAYEPVAQQLELLRNALADLPDEDTEGDGPDLDSVPLEERLSQRSRRLAMEWELGRLERAASQRQEAVRNAQELVRSIERDQAPDLRSTLGQARAWLAEPPVGDLSKLAAVAPQAVQWRAGRIGTVLLTEAGGASARTPHVAHVQVVLEQQLAMCGMLDLLRADWLKELLGKVDPKTQREIQLALNPPDLTPLPQEQLTPGQVVQELQHPRAENDLPLTGSPEAQRQIAAMNANQREFARRQARDQQW